MTVKELIQKLSELPDQNKDVVVTYNGLNLFGDILEVEACDADTLGYLLRVKVDFDE